MKKLFLEVNSLDERCYNSFGLNEYILMEHAALRLYKEIEKLNKKDILIVSGPGNNGADGLALTRLLFKKYNVKVLLPYGVKTDMARFQLNSLKNVGFDNFVDDITNSDIIVDCLFGSGLNKQLKDDSIELINSLNIKNSYKIACDIPSGLDIYGNYNKACFKADLTVTMGAIKLALVSDNAKDFVGDIVVANLGIDNTIYEDTTNYYLLEESDLKLPLRYNKNSNKGTFGHLNVIVGEKKGASILSAIAGFSFGAGLVSLITKNELHCEPYLMQSKTLSKNVSAICVGMGLGKKYDKKLLDNNIPKVIDADLFYDDIIIKLLKQKNIVLTPHPKEFCSLLKLTDIADIDINILQQNRIKYAQKFCKKFKNVVLVLKGANIIIAQNENIYISNIATNNLSKGGSGDVLSGVIGSLLAQHHDILSSAINGVLAFCIGSKNYLKNNYSLNPLELINELKVL